MNQETDLQKRMFIFFIVVAVLMIGYSVLSSYYFSKEKPVAEKKSDIQTAQKKQETAVSETKKQKTQTVVSYSGGSFNLLLGSRRVNTDSLKNIVTVRTDFGEVKFSKVGGRVVSIYVDKYRTDIISDFAKNNRIFPTEIITTNPQLTALINFSEYSFKKEGNSYIFTLKKDGIKVEKRFVFENSVFSLKIKTEGLEKEGIAIINGIVLTENTSAFGHSGAIIKTDKELIKIDADIDREQIIRGNILWAGEENKYFIQLLATKNGFNTTHVIPVAEEKTVVISEISPEIEGFFFGGPKLHSLLESITENYKKS
ncbi:MAG: membrane protein insertase YidC [Persephonella sp.]|nr:membrane protein insertase YidC [Persephonella sp.]